MIPVRRFAIAMLFTLGAFQASPAQAQWGYPGGYGGYGWGGWGASTVQGDIARGMGVWAAGAGVYNRQTAEANAINADTVMHWNEYMYQSQQVRNRRYWQRQARNRDANIQAQATILARLRDNPEPRDVFQGSALNVAVEEINDPRVYVKALSGAMVDIGGARVRQIPFQYAPAGITASIHQLATSTVPAPLRRPEFEAERKKLKDLDEKLTALAEDDKPFDPKLVDELLDTLYAMREKAATILPANGLDAKQADRWLRAMHALVAMVKSPDVDKYLEGVEKRPNVTLGELLSFMSAFNLRFGVATTPEQRDVYSFLYPRLVELRNQVAPKPLEPAVSRTTGNEPEEFLSGLTNEDLRIKAPRPGAR